MNESMKQLESDLVARVLDKTLGTRPCTFCNNVEPVIDGRYAPHLISKVVEGRAVTTMAICPHSGIRTPETHDEFATAAIRKEAELLAEIRDLMRQLLDRGK